MGADTRNRHGASVQDYLKSALEHTLASGRSVRDFSEFTLERFGDSVLPELRNFFHNVRHGRTEIKGLARAAKKRVIGLHVSPQEREEMIRLAAYLRAEQRGFRGGSPEQDWYAAAREVDARLEQEAGLVARGRESLRAANVTAQEEYVHLKQIVTGWFAEKVGEDGGNQPLTGAAGDTTKTSPTPATLRRGKTGKARTGDTGTAKKGRSTTATTPAQTPPQTTRTNKSRSGSTRTTAGRRNPKA